jgi:hypothetical protein
MALTLTYNVLERNDELYKKCNKCLEIKPLVDFYKKTDTKDGLMSHCKVCRKEYDRTRYNKNPEFYIKYAKERRLNNPHLHRRRALRKLYNITLEEYNTLFVKQNGCCAICGIHQSDLETPMCVDHNHVTKEIRGLLCRKCNSGIAFLKENTLILHKAIEYLNGKNNKQ